MQSKRDPRAVVIMCAEVAVVVPPRFVRRGDSNKSHVVDYGIMDQRLKAPPACLAMLMRGLPRTAAAPALLAPSPLSSTLTNAGLHISLAQHSARRCIQRRISKICHVANRARLAGGAYAASCCRDICRLFGAQATRKPAFSVLRLYENGLCRLLIQF